MKDITYETACKISDHLLKTNQEFCYTENNELVSKQDCEDIIDRFNTLTR